jgi:hypothetical protein
MTKKQSATPVGERKTAARPRRVDNTRKGGLTIVGGPDVVEKAPAKESTTSESPEDNNDANQA